MRNRRLRVVLTCATLILLMFTVISFTSIRTYLPFYRVDRPKLLLHLSRDFGTTPLFLIACGPNGNNADWTRRFFSEAKIIPVKSCLGLFLIFPLICNNTVFSYTISMQIRGKLFGFDFPY
jgi:hypothetical protein